MPDRAALRPNSVKSRPGRPVRVPQGGAARRQPTHAARKSRYAMLRCSRAGAVSSLPRTNSSMSWKRSKGGKTKLNDRRHAVPYMCAIHMQCTCYAHTVLCLSDAYAMHVQCTCNAHAMRVSCQSMHLQRTGYASAMRFNAHAEHMLCACCSYVMHVQ